MVLAAILILAVGFLAYANGANDNFKGVATLFGSKTTGYKPALAWATLSTLAGSAASILSLSALRTVEPALDTEANCVQRYTGSFVGVRRQTLLDCAHYASAGMVCFARGLNDTPKIVALLLGVQALGLRWGMVLVACLMAVGGVLNSRKVAEKMSKKITPLNPGQGFSANLVTAVLVLFASRFGLPVSTTHVSVGSLMGIGTVTGRADAGVVRAVLLSWLLTLPAAALLGAAAYFVIGN